MVRNITFNFKITMFLPWKNTHVTYTELSYYWNKKVSVDKRQNIKTFVE